MKLLFLNLKKIILIWSVNCVTSSHTAANQVIKITDTKFHVTIVTLSTDHNANLFRQLKTGFKWTTNWNKYQLKVTIQKRNQYLDYLTDPVFQGINWLFCFIIWK